MAVPYPYCCCLEGKGNLCLFADSFIMAFHTPGPKAFMSCKCYKTSRQASFALVSFSSTLKAHCCLSFCKGTFFGSTHYKYTLRARSSSFGYCTLAACHAVLYGSKRLIIFTLYATYNLYLQ